MKVGMSPISRPLTGPDTDYTDLPCHANHPSQQLHPKAPAVVHRPFRAVGIYGKV